MTFASVLLGGGFSRNIFFSKRDVFHMIFFFLACLFQVHLAIWAPCVFLTLPYLCFWQLAASVHSIRVQGSVTKTFCGGTTGHSNCSYWHEWPEPGGAIQIRKGDNFLLPLERKSYSKICWHTRWSFDEMGNFLESDFFRVRDITAFVEKE